MIRRLFVKGVSGRHGVFRGGCLGGTALPIRRPRLRHWRFRELRERVEMGCRARRVIKEAKRDPARVEFRFELHFMRHRGMFGAELVSGFRVVLIKEFSGKKPAFGPPFVPVNEKRGIARRGEQNIYRGADFLGVAQFVDLGEEEAGVGPERRRHLGKKLVARRFVNDRGAGFGEG